MLQVLSMAPWAMAPCDEASSGVRWWGEWVKRRGFRETKKGRRRHRVVHEIALQKAELHSTGSKRFEGSWGAGRLTLRTQMGV